MLSNVKVMKKVKSLVNDTLRKYKLKVLDDRIVLEKGSLKKKRIEFRKDNSIWEYFDDEKFFIIKNFDDYVLLLSRRDVEYNMKDAKKMKEKVQLYINNNLKIFLTKYFATDVSKETFEKIKKIFDPHYFDDVDEE